MGRSASAGLIRSSSARARTTATSRARRESAQAGEGHVLAHVHRTDEPQPVAIFREKADPGRDPLARRARIDGTAVERQAASVPRVGPEDRAHDLAPPGADEPRHPEDLAAAEDEAHGADSA